ncbi:MAG: AtpZ/AtpI family protein [Dehalococcoidia bacterium]|nr:AtpZ/AtpI family protein [Dehalococcoidia bacterium]
MYESPAFRLVGIGFYFVVSILIPLLLGMKIDEKLDSDPIFTILMLVFGLIIAFVGAYRQIQEVVKNKHR